ncbi:translation initiation factor IF-3 [Christensenellaceae bacterium OttesenSCG-928-K19]|nr:translation initiation factor IF-3 [Christensenellaceae bacterium OttesenSCG-928-K19]
MTLIANDLFINEQIRDKEVRVIGADGEQLGVMPLEQAMKLAEEADMDLANISPKANPPVCKIMDYGKYKFEQGKKLKEAKKHQKTVEIKEMRLSATIDTHDMEIKAKNVRKFLLAGDKVKVSIRFRGRQLAHTDKGRAVMTQFIEMLEDVGTVEKNAKMEGRSMFMVLTPKTEKK